MVDKDQEENKGVEEGQNGGDDADGGEKTGSKDGASGDQDVRD